MDWIKLYTRKWIWGSGRNMTAEKRGIWVDLLAVAAETKLRDGTLRHDVNQPMAREWIASILCIDLALLNACISSFQADINADDGQPRIKIWEDGTIQITNWVKYQDSGKDIIRERSIKKQKRLRNSTMTMLDALLREVKITTALNSATMAELRKLVDNSPIITPEIYILLMKSLPEEVFGDFVKCIDHAQLVELVSSDEVDRWVNEPLTAKELERAKAEACLHER